MATTLASLTESLKTTDILITRLGKLTFQPGSEPLDSEGGIRVELAQDIQDSLKQLSEDLELLKQEVDDLKPEGGLRRRQSVKDNEEARLSAKIVRLGEELTESRQRFRSAQVSAKYASEQSKRRERQALLEGYRRDAAQLDSSSVTHESAREQLFAARRKNQQQKNLTKDEVLVNASSDVTAALRRTHDLLSTELTRSRFAQETFDQSTAALAQLGEEYSNLDTVLTTSRNLIGTLLKSQKSDSWYLETAFYILITTLCWLIFRRLLFGPFFKLPLFLWKTTIFILNWTVIKPFLFFVTITGILTPVDTSVASISSSSRPPLIVQPSASDRAQAFPSVGHYERGVPVGAGGEGARVGPSYGGLSESIGRMAEASAQAAKSSQSSKEDSNPHEAANIPEKDIPRRGDGTVLKERGDEQANPRKKVFEADVEDAKHEARQKREL